MRRFLTLAAVLGFSVGLIAQTNDPSSSSPSPVQQESGNAPASDSTRGQAAEAPAGEKYTSPCPATTVGPTHVDPKDISTGLLIHKVVPKYPKAARKAHIQGTVVLCADISKDGIIENLRAISGAKELIPAAMEAVRQWRYRPYMLKNEPVEVNTEVRVNFALSQ